MFKYRENGSLILQTKHVFAHMNIACMIRVWEVLFVLYAEEGTYLLPPFLLPSDKLLIPSHLTMQLHSQLKEDIIRDINNVIAYGYVWQSDLMPSSASSLEKMKKSPLSIFLKTREDAI